MSIGRPNFGKVYTEAQLRKLKAQNCCNTTSEQHIESENSQDNIAAQQNVKKCNCQPAVWPAPYNPPAVPSVLPRPYPPEFYPLPQDVAIVTVDKNHTSAVINNCESHEDIYHYVSGNTINDINIRCENTLLSANTYTDNRFAYYDESEEISGVSIRDRKILRYRGKLNESLFSIKVELSGKTEGFKDQTLINHYINNYQLYPKFHIFKDLRIGDLFIVPVSSAISTLNNLADEYICTKSTPISAADFEKIGSNNIEDIEKYLRYLDNRITDQKNDILSTINNVSTALTTYIGTQINILEAKAAASAVSAEFNANIFTTNLVNQTSAVTLAFASAYTDYVSGLLQLAAAGSAIIAEKNANEYTDAEIKKLGNVFNIKGFMPAATLSSQLAMPPYIYIKYRYQNPATRYIAEEILAELKIGNIYLTKEYEPISAIAEYLYTASSVLYADAINSNNWQKLGTNSGYALSADVTKLISEVSAKTLADAKDYTNQQINTLEIKTVISAATLSTNIINYTNNLVAASTDFAISSAVRYTNLVSGILADTDKILDQKIDTTSSNIYIHIEEVSGKLQRNAALSAVSAYQNAKIYTDIEVLSARNDLSSYVDITSSNIVKYISSHINTDFDGMMKYAGYVHSEFTWQKPWEHAAHQQTKSDFLKYLYKGKVYTVNELAYGTNDTGKVISDTITAQYMYIGQTSAATNCASAEYYWLKLGQAVNLSAYSTIGYINNIANATRTDLSSYIDTASANAYKYTDDIVKSAKEDLSSYVDTASANAYTYTDDTVKSAKEDLSSYVDIVSANAYKYTNDTVKSARIDLSSYVDRVSANAYTYTDDTVKSARIDLSSYVDNRVTGLGTVFRIKGYALSSDHTVPPWRVDQLNPVSGDVYLRDVVISSTVSGGQISETAEYLYIGGEKLIENSYQKLGNASLTNNYATVNYVKAISAELDTNIKNINTQLNTEITTRESEIAATRSELISDITLVSTNISNIIVNTIQPEQNIQNSRLTSIEYVISGQTNSLSGCLDGIINNTNTTLRTVSAYLENKLANKADKATTLAGYEISDAYTKSDVYTKEQIENKGYLTKHQSLSAYYKKDEVDNIVNTTVDYISANLIGSQNAEPGTDTVYANINYIKMHELTKLSGFSANTDIKAYIDNNNDIISGKTSTAAADIKAISGVIGQQITSTSTVFDEIAVLKNENDKLVTVIGQIQPNLSKYMYILDDINNLLNK